MSHKPLKFDEIIEERCKFKDELNIKITMNEIKYQEKAIYNMHLDINMYRRRLYCAINEAEEIYIQYDILQMEDKLENERNKLHKLYLLYFLQNNKHYWD